MKTIIRIGRALDTPEALGKEGFSAFPVQMLAEVFAKARDEFSEGLLIVHTASDKLPVYLAMSNWPPEILPGDRPVYAVFWPPEAQEPIATFGEEQEAIAWAKENRPDDCRIRAIDSTDSLTVQASVAVIVRDGPNVLLCRLKKNKEWMLPEGRIGLGEAVDAAARRALKNIAGITIGPTRIPAPVPYVNTFIRTASQHILTLVLDAEIADGVPALREDDTVYDKLEWHPADNPPRPWFATMKAIVKMMDEGRETPEKTEEKPKPAKSSGSNGTPAKKQKRGRVPVRKKRRPAKKPKGCDDCGR